MVFGLLKPAGFFKSIDPHFDGSVVNIYTVASGTEDIDIDYPNEVLLISSTNRRNQSPEMDPNNGIYALNLNGATAQPYKIPTDYIGEMSPHGISVFVEDSISYVYVINHVGENDFIELLEYRYDSLIVIDRFSDPSMVSPNDIHGISTTEFYITNDHSSKDEGQSTKEDYLRLENRNIIHYSAGTYTEVASDMAMPNGINGSIDGTLIYASTTLGQELITFDRNIETGTLTEINRQYIGSGLDNIDVDEQGNLWIGSHPKMLTFVSHAGDAAKLSPSQIFKLSPTANKGVYDVEEVFLSNGDDISASSIGVTYDGDLFIGAVFDKKVYRGKMN